MPKSYGYAFVLEVGKTAYYTNIREAKEFKKSYGDIIAKMIRFPTKKEYEDHRKMSELTSTPTTVKSNVRAGDEPKSADLTEAEQRVLQSIKRSIDTSRPSDKLEFHFKVTAMSSVAVIIVRFKNVDGKDDWRMKPKSLQEALTNYHGHLPCKDSIIQEFIASFFLCEQRDPDGGPSKVLTNSWKSPTSGKSMSFSNLLLCGQLTVPHATLANANQEDQFIRNKLESAGQHLKNVMATRLFESCYEHSINQPKVWAAIGDPDKPVNYYRNYVTAAKVAITRTCNLNRHVVKDETRTLMAILFDNRVPALKYPEDKVRITDRLPYDLHDIPDLHPFFRPYRNSLPPMMPVLAATNRVRNSTRPPTKTTTTTAIRPLPRTRRLAMAQRTTAKTTPKTRRVPPPVSKVPLPTATIRPRPTKPAKAAAQPSPAAGSPDEKLPRLLYTVVSRPRLTSNAAFSSDSSDDELF